MRHRFEHADSESAGAVAVMILAICLVASPITVNISFGQQPDEGKHGAAIDSEVDTESDLDWGETVADSAVEKASTQQLSIEPSSQPMLPTDAPAWIGAAPDFSSEVHRLHVGGQIAETEDEAAEALDEDLLTAVRDYIDNQVLRHPGASNALKRNLTADFIWRNLIDVPEGYVVQLNTTGVPMYQKWVTVSITPEQREIFENWDREAMQRRRLVPVGLGMLGLLGCVSLFRLVLRRR